MLRFFAVAVRIVGTLLVILMDFHSLRIKRDCILRSFSSLCLDCYIGFAVVVQHPGGAQRPPHRDAYKKHLVCPIGFDGLFGILSYSLLGARGTMASQLKLLLICEPLHVLLFPTLYLEEWTSQSSDEDSDQTPSRHHGTTLSCSLLELPGRTTLYLILKTLHDPRYFISWRLWNSSTLRSCRIGSNISQPLHFCGQGSHAQNCRSNIDSGKPNPVLVLGVGATKAHL